MFQHLQSYLLFGNQFCGVEHTSKKESDTIYVNVLKKTKTKVDIAKSFSAKTIDGVAGNLSKKQHVFLIINNGHVLTGTLENESSEDLKLVNKAFPNINISEFYYEVIRQNAKCFVSVCRKTYVNDLIAAYIKLGVSIINFSLGNSILSNMVNYIKTACVQTSNALVFSNNDFIDRISFTEETNEEHYSINGLNSSSSYILSLSGGLTSILNDYQSTSNFQDKKGEFINDFKQIRFFSQFFKIGLILTLSLLFINFLFFNFYYKKVNVLQETSQLNENAKTKILTLNEAVNKAQKMSDDMLENSVSRSSFFIDVIVQSLPESILLTEINYQPLDNRIKEDKSIALQINSIIISGISNNSALYSDWILSLEGIKWINKVDVISYNDSKKSMSEFSIKMYIDDK
ncbi:general secretion pathway protein [Postechiella marina]|uniref:General secretion pathway protein n=1 Tax=Postechiella marina TaxID=943941 RepID=A0ABP8C8U2_9FLAO